MISRLCQNLESPVYKSDLAIINASLWQTYHILFYHYYCLLHTMGGGPRVVVSTAAFHARVRGSVPGLGGFKETKMFLPHPRVKVSIVGSLRDREVACSASDRQGPNFESCVWRTVSSQSSHHPQEVLLAQFSLYVHKGGLKPDSFHFSSYHTVMFRYFVNPIQSGRIANQWLVLSYFPTTAVFLRVRLAGSEVIAAYLRSYQISVQREQPHFLACHRKSHVPLSWHPSLGFTNNPASWFPRVPWFPQFPPSWATLCYVRWDISQMIAYSWRASKILLIWPESSQ